MEINPLFFVLSFIVIIAIIYLSDSYTTAALTISIFVNFLLISTNLGKIHRKLSLSFSPVDREPLQQRPVSGSTESELSAIAQVDDSGLKYSPDFNDYQAYKTSYSTGYADAQLKGQLKADCGSGNAVGDLEYILADFPQVTSVDSAAATMAGRRFHDKKTLDGVALKSADYYKYHFGDELKVEEEKRWWGQYEM